MTITSTVSPLLRNGLQFLGVWPNVPYSNISLIYISSLLVIQYFQYTYLFTHLKFSELQDLVDNILSTLTFSLTFFKVGILRVYRGVVHEMLAAMDSDWRECVNVEQHLRVMTIKANISHLFCNAIVNFNSFSSVLYVLGGYVVRLVFLANDNVRQLPIKIKLPFDSEKSPVFELLFVMLILHVLLDGYIISTLNALIFTLVSFTRGLVFHTSGQIEIACQELKTISDRIIHYKSSYSMLGILSERHNRIIKFSNNINKLFSLIALMEVILNTLVICFLGFLVMISVRDADIGLLAKTALAYVSVMLDIFILCFAGEYLADKSKTIGNAVYKLPWYEMALNQCKMISFVIMRSQKQLTITAGGITYLSLNAFASIMRASASYMSILYAMS